MKLKVLVPVKILLEETVTKINAEAENGAFGILPHHIDFVTAIVPGLLLFDRENSSEGVIAVDEGILVKQGDEVRVSTRRAVQGEDLETLQHTVEEEFEQLDDREKQARSALARLEAGFLRGTYEFGSGSYESPT
ncbi:MAG: F0F1 ATP synthase subunit epsilon [Elainellaceae cyanobacterium]